MTFERDKPYDDLPLLPPPPGAFESVAVYRALGIAKASLAELKGRLPVIPNPLMLINTLVLQEARDSSSIENIFTTSDKLYRAFSSSSAGVDPSTKEVLRYREALWNAHLSLEAGTKWNRDLIVSIFQKITGKEEGVREGQNYIRNAFTTIYTPPSPGEILYSKLDNLIEYIEAKNGVDPLIKLAIMHYQFEALHPFTDGNGRTGRILNVLYLTHNSLLEWPVLYLSNYILDNKAEYYRLLKNVTENSEWQNWIIFMLKAIEETSLLTLNLVNAIYELFCETKEIVQREDKSVYSYELIEALFSQPYVRIGVLVEKGIASRNTASKYLKRLVELNVLSASLEGRDALYLNTRLYELLSRGVESAQ